MSLQGLHMMKSYDDAMARHEEMMEEIRLMNKQFNPIKDYFNSLSLFNNYAEAIGLPRYEIFTGKARYFGSWYLKSTIRLVGMILIAFIGPLIPGNPGDAKILIPLGILLFLLLAGAYDFCLISYIKGAKEVYERNQQKISIITLKASGFQADEIKIKGDDKDCHTCYMPIDLYNLLMQQNVSHITDQTLGQILSHNPDLANSSDQKLIFLYIQSYLNKLSGCGICIKKSMSIIQATTAILIIAAIFVIIGGIRDLSSQR